MPNPQDDKISDVKISKPNNLESSHTNSHLGEDNEDSNLGNQVDESDNNYEREDPNSGEELEKPVKKPIAAWKIITPIIAVLLLLGILIWSFRNGSGTEKLASNSSSSNNSTFAITISQEKKSAKPSDKQTEKLEQVLNAELKTRRKSANPKCSIECEFEWYMGWVSVEAMKSNNINIPTFDPKDTGFDKIPDTLLDNLIPVPEDSTKGACKDKKDYLWYDAQKIEVPIIQTALEDMFAKNDDGTLNYSQVISKNFEDYADAGPIQKKLRGGVVHLAISPQAGNIGNSYISGHSSNNVDTKTPENNKYNEVFKSVEQGALGKGGAKIGEKFIICDYKGRKLQFNVFEAKIYKEYETNEMWKNYTDKRVVTLQASHRTAEDIAARRGPSERAIIRGELMMEESKTLNKVGTNSTTAKSTANSVKK